MAPILGMLASAGLDLLGKFIDAGKEKAVEVIKEKTGIDLSSKRELSKEEIEKLKEFQEKNREFLLKELELVLKDKQDARHMQEVALRQDDVFSKRFIYYFAFFWSVVASVYIYLVTFNHIDASNQRFADTIIGFLLGTIIATIIAFFYGSSLGSKNKEERLLDGKHR